MDARAIIAKIRDKHGLDPTEVRWFSDGLANGDVTDAQAGAFAMAVLLNGLSNEERVALTMAMRDSGHVMTWDLPAPVIDKHSTGGIGDATSLLLAPALAALGCYVPMVSGRGLGHTGGTLDKLEAIPGLDTEVSEHRFREIVEHVGTAIVSATADIAPADKRLYAIRDVTATVESIDLITASILSKKLAVGHGALILDVKVGSGAFMKDLDHAEALARSLVDTANGAGCRTAALITDMDQPLTTSAGNALEMMEVMQVLTGGQAGGHLAELSARLCGELLVLAGASDDVDTSAAQVMETFADGSAAERFGRMVAELGGPADFVECWRDRLPAAKYVREIPAISDGYVRSIDGERLGLAVVNLGGGRMKGGDRIDPAVGLSNLALIGQQVGQGQPLALVHAASEAAVEQAIVSVQAAYQIGPELPEIPPLVVKSVR
ncbi:MAG: thymidine phosphorylase [Paracoccaceae bacterium]|nr:thymidine phosphorylase [Paracoccaceae bacterium]